MTANRANQEVLGKLVAREIEDNVSTLVEHFLSNPGALVGSDYNESDLMEMSNSVNYELTIENWWAGLDMEEKTDVFQAHGLEHESELYEAGTREELIREWGIDLEYSETLEYWIVSKHLGRKLAEKGEAVCMDFFGLIVWGRVCSGQAILLDGVIEDIGRDMEILEGQENHVYWIRD